MKKLIIAVALLVASTASLTAQSYTRQGNTFVAVRKATTAKESGKKTAYTWKDSKGNEYPIYQSASGSCYVLRTSRKTGKEYKQYLEVEISTEIARLTGVKYEPRTRK